MKFTINLYTDGGARGNPGPGACSYFIFQDHDLLNFGGKYLGITTNNQAEYQGLILGLTEISKLKNVGNLNVFMDSELIVNQINKIYKVKDQKITELFKSVSNLLTKINASIEFFHIPRSQNHLADKMVNILLDNFENSSR